MSCLWRCPEFECDVVASVVWPLLNHVYTGIYIYIGLYIIDGV